MKLIKRLAALAFLAGLLIQRRYAAVLALSFALSAAGCITWAVLDDRFIAGGVNEVRVLDAQSLVQLNQFYWADTTMVVVPNEAFLNEQIKGYIWLFGIAQSASVEGHEMHFINVPHFFVLPRLEMPAVLPSLITLVPDDNRALFITVFLILVCAPLLLRLGAIVAVGATTMVTGYHVAQLLLSPNGMFEPVVLSGGAMVLGAFAAGCTHRGYSIMAAIFSRLIALSVLGIAMLTISEVNTLALGAVAACVLIQPTALIVVLVVWLVDDALALPESTTMLLYVLGVLISMALVGIKHSRTGQVKAMPA